jgi:hypothetical protein
MAEVKVDLDFRRPMAVIDEAMDKFSFEAAHLVKGKADRKVHVGKVSRPTYVAGKSKGAAWTSRRPGRLKKTGRAYKSKYKQGGSIVMYGSFMGFYGFMHHWGVRNRYGKEIAANRYLSDSLKSSKGEINRLAAKRVEEATR